MNAVYGLKFISEVNCSVINRFYFFFISDFKKSYSYKKFKQDKKKMVSWLYQNGDTAKKLKLEENNNILFRFCESRVLYDTV